MPTDNGPAPEGCDLAGPGDAVIADLRSPALVAQQKGRAARLTEHQREALAAVTAGRVTYGDPHPAQLARRVAAAKRRVARGEVYRDIIGTQRPIPTEPYVYAQCVFLVDGEQAYGGQLRTLGVLSDRELLEARANPEDCSPAPVTLTDAGRAALEGRPR